MGEVIAITVEQDVVSAEQMARTATDPAALCANLATLASTVARQPDQELATRLIVEAHDLARVLTDKNSRAAALMSVAQAVADNGDPARAAALVRESVELGTDAESVMSVARGDLSGRRSRPMRAPAGPVPSQEGSRCESWE